MKALQINKYGGAEALELNNIPEPTPNSNQVLVEVRGAGLNPLDYKVVLGYLKDTIPLRFPTTLGGDFSGIIKKIGEGVSNFKIGDKVYGSANIFSGGSGAFAEFASAEVKNIALNPQAADFYEAAALPLVASSAMQALLENIKLKEGDAILIHGGAGGIGHIAVQLAKTLGAYVAVTVSAKDKNFVKNLGADEVIDYQNEQFEKRLSVFDAVLDTVGGEVTNKSFAVLKNDGIILSFPGEPDQALAEKYGVRAITQNTIINTERLRRVGELIDEGKIKVWVNKIFFLEEADEAWEELREGHARGKIVLKIK